MRPVRLATLTCAAAALAFVVVQDRGTSAGARQYVVMYHAAAAGGAPFPAIDEVMQPAVRRSVRQGLLAAGAVLAGGVGVGAMLQSARRRAALRR